MKLFDLFKNIGEPKVENVEISGITFDSRKVLKNSLFVCIKGEHFDAVDFVDEALAKGAAYIVCDRNLDIPNQIIVNDTKLAYGELCATWFDHPEKKLKLIGVTGTNGKTTMTTLIKHILTESGHKVGLIGTIQNEIGDKIYHTENTTPFAFDLMELLDKMVKAGCEYAVMEVSSFALVQNRIGPAEFCCGIFTNLTQDHLDYHKTMEEYYQAKKILFTRSAIKIINLDDDYGRRLYKEIDGVKYSFSCYNKADFYAENIKISSDKSSFVVCYNDKCYSVSLSMPGVFNVSNSIAAIACCLKLGVTITDVVSAVRSCKGVKGRCEVIPTGRDFTVICDYAHTPDAITNILSSVKTFTKGRLISLFGCGGNRDKTKRPKMAAAAAEYSDYVIVTSDNPRDESPSEIIKDVIKGFEGTGIQYNTFVDRVEAIEFALKFAKKDDVIVLAGKGHEDYQVLENDLHIHLDEREIVAKGLMKL